MKTTIKKVAFDNTFKADNGFSSNVSRVNGMIGWMMRTIISRESKFQKYLKP